jgi:hypothetical protein
VLDGDGRFPLTPEIATPLYTQDLRPIPVRWFAYDATSSRALSLAARLVDAGSASPNDIWRELECRKSLQEDAGLRRTPRGD